MSEIEIAPEVINRELHRLHGMYQVNDGMLPTNESHYRLGEPANVWKLIDQKHLLVISGTKGEGKTSLLRQLEGEHPNQFTYWTVNDSDLYTEEFDLDDQTIHGYDDLLSYLRDTGRTFGIDEYTQILDDVRGRPEYEKFKQFVAHVHSLGVPLAIVIHHVPRLLDRFIMDSDDLEYDQIYYPKPITPEELHFGSLHGPFHRRDSVPFTPSILKIDDGLGAKVLEIAGDNPLLINSFWTRLIQDLFTTDFDGRISAETLHNFWFNQSRSSRTGSYNITRVFDFAWNRFRADPKELGYFKQIISSPNPDFSNVDVRLQI